MKKIRSVILFLAAALSYSDAAAQFTVSPNGHYIRKNGKPFLWIGDTAWELFHRLGVEDAEKYFAKRSQQGFTVVQAVVLAEMDGLRVPNVNGERPFTDTLYQTPNSRYFDHVDALIALAAKYNLTVALLPTWGDKIFSDRWGKGPEIFNSSSAYTYASWLAKRLSPHSNIIWVLGGDRNPRHADDEAIWNAMGKAIMTETKNGALITYHPQPNDLGSAEWFHEAPWLAFNMFQTGHCRQTAVYDRIAAVYKMKPTKPVLDGEPIYEDHPVCFNARDLGVSNAYDVRRAAYLDLFAGAFGHTYGCHDIWQMYNPAVEPVNGPNRFWYDALDLPGAIQMGHVSRLMQIFNTEDRVPDQGILLEPSLNAGERIQATRGKDFMLIYSATGRKIGVKMTSLPEGGITAYWYDPRNGKCVDIGVNTRVDRMNFQPPTQGYGQDWILVVTSNKATYARPTLNQ